MTELILIRHGETDWNREARFQGQIDVPLNATGRQQAMRLAPRLAQEPALAALYCSDLLRTRQTAQPSETRLDLAAAPDAGLREQAFGELEGLSFDEARQRYPDLLAAWMRHDPDYALPGGESVSEFHARVVAALVALARRHRGERIAIVTHGGVLDMIYRRANAQPLVGPRICAIPNAGLNRVRLTAGGSFEIVVWADDAHLAESSAAR